MVFGLFGNYFLLLKEFSGEGSLKTFVEQKPNLAGGILEKLEPVVTKLVHKGHTRHSIVQAILKDYLSVQTEKDKLMNLADSIKEKIPALLASKEGLAVACGLFNVLDAKDRKVVVKTLPVAEMAQNRIAHLFLVHVATTLDDTQLTKKKVLHEALKAVDDLIGDKHYQQFLISCLLPHDSKNPYLLPEEKLAFETLKEFTTSKKDAATRQGELFKIAQKPLEMFFEEKLTYYLQNIREQPVLRNLLTGIAYCKFHSFSNL